MPTIVLIRHGNNDFMQKGLAGRLPGVHLNESGRQQAYSLAGKLAMAPIKAIYSSPMERALETARPLAEVKGLAVQERPGLIEMDYGEWQGKTFKQLQRLKLWKLLMKDPAQMRFPGGESICEAQERACLELESIAAEYGDKDLLTLFTHGDIIRLLVAHFLEMPLRAYHKLSANTASITILSLNKENQVHLPVINHVEGLKFTKD
jgi:broad specificity phosphatase PhoE